METREKVFTRRQFLTYQLIVDGTPWWEAVEAVSTTALEHPDWDMDEEMTWSEWEKKR